MNQYTYSPRGVCSAQIDFGIENGKLHGVRFHGGCNGNLKAIGTLLEGADASETAQKLAGNTCGPRPTSCADQLSRAIVEALARPAR